MNKLYSDTLYDIAERVKAKSIIEGGLGAGVSARAFISSLANRPGGHLTTVEIIRQTAPRQDDLFYASAKKVKWDVIYDDLMSVHLKTPCDLLYIDGPASEDGILRAYKNLGWLVRKGGLIVVDGVGQHMIRQGHHGHDEAVAEIAVQNKTKAERIDYQTDCGFGIVVKA